jgi:hypothetical protein
MSLKRERFLSRRGVGVLLGVQLLGAGLVPLADASLDAALHAAEVHVEDVQDGPCAPRHDHQHCVLCQHLAHQDGMAPTVSALHMSAPPRAVSPDAAGNLPDLTTHPTKRSRAPPRA